MNANRIRPAETRERITTALGPLPRAEPGRVTIVIPCYNQADFLSDAIESALRQSYSAREIIVVDDGSVDQTREISQRYKNVCYIYQQNMGVSAARNNGLRHSHGEFIVFLDADDRLLPSALEVGVDQLQRHGEAVFVSGHCRVSAADGRVFASAPQPAVERDHYLHLLRGNYIWCPATVMFRRRIFEAVGGFDVRLHGVEDYDLYLRIARDFAVLSHTEVVADYRRHGLSASADIATMQQRIIALHDAQQKVLPATAPATAAYKFGQKYWRDHFNYLLMVARVREVVASALPKDATVLVMSRGHKELLRLQGRRAWHFPQKPDDSAEQLIHRGSDGSAKVTWIEVDLAYEFRLYSGTDRLLEEVLVSGVPGLLEAPKTQRTGSGPYLVANPNPVPVTRGLGSTVIAWSTGDGSDGRVVVSVGGSCGDDPKSASEAIEQVKNLRRRGAQYLVVPANAFEWLDHCSDFKDYLEKRCSRKIADKACVIYGL